VPAASFADESVEELTARMRELFVKRLGPAAQPAS
jgi:hypothetical protein